MVFKILRNHHSFFLLCLSPTEVIHKVCTRCNEFSDLWILYGALVQFSSDFYSSMYTDLWNPEEPRYHRWREFFWYFQLE